MSTLKSQTATKPTADAKPKYKGKSGAQILHEMLIGPHKVDTIFGYPGGAILPVFDQLYKTPAKFILNRHEQACGHCADGYYRASGKPGVCVVTSGPAATNCVTPLATAQMDSIPMIVISGQVATKVIGNDAFQEADVTGITRPCTKWNYLVKDVRELPRVINEAFAITTTGRPGPVLVDLPKDVSVAICPEEVDDTPREHILHRQRTANNSPDQEKQAHAAAELINRSEKPVLYVGGGAIIAGASETVRKVALKANIPCTTTLLGLGAFDEHDPKALNMLGMHGSAYANYAVQDCDCLIAVGARFDDRVTGNLATFAPHAKIIHIDIDPSSISKTVDVDIPVIGDAKLSLELMLPHLEYRDRSTWFNTINSWKKRYPFKYLDDSAKAKPQYVIEELHRQSNGEAIITTGVGQHQMWAAQFYRWRFPRQMITSGGLGTMGFGLPSALGAAMAAPGKTVIDIDGDASFLMTCYELATLAEYNIPVKVAILNNDFQGMIKQWQDLFYEKRYSQSVMKNPDFAKMAEAFGCRGIRCEHKSDVSKVVGEMLAHKGPVVVDFVVEPNEHVYPMVPSGKGLHEMELGTLAELTDGHAVEHMPTQLIASKDQRVKLSAHLRRQLHQAAGDDAEKSRAPHANAGLFRARSSKKARQRFILFTPPLVRAILDGRKSVTRRFAGAGKMPPVKCPYGAAGESLWVREKWGYRGQFFNRKAAPQPPFVYAADGPPSGAKCHPWKPSLHMPRSACRLVLEITSLHAERLQEITPQDAIAEGCPGEYLEDPIAWFRGVWDRLSSDRGHGWKENPWVWVIRFAPIEVGS